MGAVGAGVWFFLRKRAMGRGGSDDDYPDYPRYSTGPAMSEQGMQPSQMRLYVSLFTPSTRPTCILTYVDRIHPIHPPSPAKVITKRVGDTRPQQPTRAITMVSRSCERLAKVLNFPTLWDTHFLAWTFTLLFRFPPPHASRGLHGCNIAYYHCVARCCPPLVRQWPALLCVLDIHECRHPLPDSAYG